MKEFGKTNNIKNKGVEHVLSLSYGKDSMACLGAIEKLGWPLDRIIHVEIWATNEIPADLPEMVEFKQYADEIIKTRWGITVEHISAGQTFEDVFYRTRGQKSKCPGKIYGWPCVISSWCVSELKTRTVKRAARAIGGSVMYIGIAADEPVRLSRLKRNELAPLNAVGWTENDCMKWCEANDLVSPIYRTTTRGGCWFCVKQSIAQLRLLRCNHPDLWALMLKWDQDSPVCFNGDHTVKDFEKRFAMEDDGKIPMGRQFKWKMLDNEND